MKTDRKYVAGIAAVMVAIAYGFSRWRDGSDAAGEQAFTAEHRTPTAD